MTNPEKLLEQLEQADMRKAGKASGRFSVPPYFLSFMVKGVPVLNLPNVV